MKAKRKVSAADTSEAGPMLRAIEIATLALLADAAIGRGAGEVEAMIIAQKRLAFAAKFLDRGAHGLLDQPKMSAKDLDALHSYIGLRAPMGYSEFIAFVAFDNGPKTSSAIIDRWLAEKYPGEGDGAKELLLDGRLPAQEGMRLVSEHRAWCQDSARAQTANARKARAEDREHEKQQTQGNKKIRREKNP